MFKDYPDILSIPQVAKALGIGRKAAYSLVNGNKLPALHIGRTIRVPKMMLEEYVKTARNNVKM